MRYICPECKGPAFEEHDEVVCQDCGRVLRTESYSYGGDEKIQVRKHIGPSIIDGTVIDGAKELDWQTVQKDDKRKLKRLRRLQYEITGQFTGYDRLTEKHITELTDKCKELGMPPEVCETATIIYLNGRKPGVSLEQQFAVAVYGAYKAHGIPRLPKDIAKKFGVEQKVMMRKYMTLKRELKLKSEVFKPQDYVVQIYNNIWQPGSDVQRPTQIEVHARDILDRAAKGGVDIGVKPSVLALTSLFIAYVSGDMYSESFRRKITKSGYCTPQALRNNISRLAKFLYPWERKNLRARGVNIKVEEEAPHV